MRNLRLFETLDEFIASQEAVSGSGEYVEDIYPGFAYIRELLETGKCVVYNGESKQGDYEFGDLIYYDGGDSLQKVYWSDFKENMGTPVGLIVVSSSMAPDGNARMIALRDIETSDVDGGSINPARNGAAKGPIEAPLTERELCEVPSSYPEGQYWYDGVAVMDIGGFSKEDGGSVAKLKSATKGSSDVEYYIDTNGNFLCSSDAVTTGGTGEVSSIENPVADGEYFISNAGAYGVSPYMTDSDEVNPNYLQEASVGRKRTAART